MSTTTSSGAYPNPATIPGKQHILHDHRPVCILGVGLIGGSMMRDLHACGRRVFGWDYSASTVDTINNDGFDASNDPAATLRRAEHEGALVVIATPLPAIGSVLDLITEHAPTCGITDVASVKHAVFDEVYTRGMQDRFVGGHPMSGTSHHGWEASHTGLFAGAPWVVTFDNAPAPAPQQAVHTPTAHDGNHTPPRTMITTPSNNEHMTPILHPPHNRWIREWVSVVNLAYDLGSEVIPARAQTHDAAVARISHVPHVVAEALAVAGDNDGALALSLAAGSFRDGTRVAGSDPALTEAMCTGNAMEVVRAIEEIQAMLAEAHTTLTATPPTIGNLAHAGYRSRRRYEARTGQRPVLRVRPGAPGWISQLEQAEHLGARIEIF